MDNLTHSLLGATLAYAGLNRVFEVPNSASLAGSEEHSAATDDRRSTDDTRRELRSELENHLSSRVTLLTILAANLPDLDIVTLPAPLFYLEHHRGYSHTFWGIVLLALLLPLPFLKWNRTFRQLHAPFHRKYLLLAVVSLLGTTSHLLLDFTNSYGVRPARPFSQRWIYGDFIPIVDPWIYLILGGVLFLIASRSLWKIVFWIAGIGTLSLLIWFYGRQTVPDSLATLRPLWFAALALIVLLRIGARTWVAERKQGLAVGCLLVLCFYYVFCWQLHERALRQVRAKGVGPFCVPFATASLAVAALPVSGNPFLWTFFVDDGSRLCSGKLSLTDGVVYTLSVFPKNPDPIAFEKVSQTCAGEVMLRFARFPVLEKEEQGDLRMIALSDLRFVSVPGRPGFGTIFIYFDRDWKEREDLKAACPWSEAIR